MTAQQLKNLDRAVFRIVKGGKTSDAPGLTYKSFLEQKLLLSQTINKGLPFGFFELIAGTCPFSTEDWAEFLDISSKSLTRYKTQEDFVFKAIHSEKILEIGEVCLKGLDTFDNREKFKNWLYGKSRALGNSRPVDLLRNS